MLQLDSISWDFISSLWENCERGLQRRRRRTKLFQSSWKSSIIRNWRYSSSFALNERASWNKGVGLLHLISDVERIFFFRLEPIWRWNASRNHPIEIWLDQMPIFWHRSLIRAETWYVQQADFYWNDIVTEINWLSEASGWWFRTESAGFGWIQTDRVFSGSHQGLIKTECNRSFQIIKERNRVVIYNLSFDWLFFVAWSPHFHSMGWKFQSMVSLPHHWIFYFSINHWSIELWALFQIIYWVIFN